MKTNPVLFWAAVYASITLAQSPGTFTPTGNMSTPRYGHTATVLTDGRVLIAGGLDRDNRLLATAELYDPTTGTFSSTGSMTRGRYLHSATLLPDGRVLITGNRGLGNAGPIAELYDPSTGTFSATADMTAGGVAYAPTLLNNGKVLVLIGGAYEGFARGPLIRAELFDPVTGAFSATRNAPLMNAQTATLLPDGRVFLAAGPMLGITSSFAGGQLYNPVTDAFTPVGDVSEVGFFGYWDTATLLANGNVLLAGGGDPDDGDAFANAALYDPARGVFISTGSMMTRRYAHRATLLPDTTVLITGGDSGCPPEGGACGLTNAGAEIYDPSTGAFRPAGNMTMARSLHVSTLLTDGTVLMAGGTAWGSSVEVYRPSVLVPAPVLFSLSQDGRGQGAILHAGTTRVVSPSDPAVEGEELEIYGTGLLDGSVIPPQVAIGGRLAEILFFGNAPGLSDVNQIHVRVPSGVAPSPAVPVWLNYLDRPSNQVTIGVR